VKSHIEEAVSILKEATDTWAELDELPERAEIQQNIQQVEATATSMKEEIKSLAALQKMRKTKEMNQLQQEAQRLRTQEVHISDLLQPYQEQITELVDVAEQKMKEFTTVREEFDQTDDSKVDQALIDSARERVEVMKNEVEGLRQKLQKTSQEAKEKLQQEKPVPGGSRTSHK